MKNTLQAEIAQSRKLILITHLHLTCSEYWEPCFTYIILFLQFFWYPLRVIHQHEIYGTSIEEATVYQKLTDLIFRSLNFDYSNIEISTEKFGKGGEGWGKDFCILKDVFQIIQKGQSFEC